MVNLWYNAQPRKFSGFFFFFFFFCMSHLAFLSDQGTGDKLLMSTGLFDRFFNFFYLFLQQPGAQQDQLPQHVSEFLKLLVLLYIIM